MQYLMMNIFIIFYLFDNGGYILKLVLEFYMILWEQKSWVMLCM